MSTFAEIFYRMWDASMTYEEARDEFEAEQEKKEKTEKSNEQ